MRQFKKAKTVVILFLIPLLGFSQFTLSGKVTDLETGESLPGAHILLSDSFKASTTDANGHYRIKNLKAGTYTIQVSFIGYNTVEMDVDVSANKKLDFQLKPAMVMSEEVIVQATRVQKSSPTTYSTLNKDQIEESNTGQDLPYIMQLTPSVVTTSDAGAGIGYTGIRIRGTDMSRINVTMNGVPVNDGESHSVYFVDLPDLASSIDNIQIQRGVGTSTNGAAAFGASINIQTTSLNANPYAEISSAAGSFNTFKNTVRFGSGLMDGKWAFDGRVSAINSDGYIDRGWSDLKSFYLSGGYYGEKSVIKAIVTSGWEKTYQAWDGTPKDSLLTNRTYNPAGAMYDKDGNFIAYYDNHTDNYHQTYYQLHFAHRFNKKLNMSSALFYTQGEGYYESFKNSESFDEYGYENVMIGTDTIFETNMINQKWLDNDFYGLNLAFNYQNGPWKATLGGGWNNYKGDHYGYTIWAQYASNSFINKPWYENTGKKRDFNIFGKVSFELSDNLNLFADLQYRGISYDMEGLHDDLRDLTQTHTFNFFNPKGGVYYELNEQSDLFASVAVANREPSRSVYRDADQNQDVKPEQLIDYELGYKFKEQKIRLEVIAFYMDYKDQLVNTGEINNVGEYNKINVAKSYRAGLEVVAGVKLTGKLTWEVNATYSSNQINDFVSYVDDWDTWGQVADTIGTTHISFSPDFVAGSNISWAAFRNFKASFISKYVGKQFIDNTSNDARSLDEYFINDLKFFYTVKPNIMKSIDFFVSLNNIFAEKYESNAWVYPYYYGGEYGEYNGYFPQAEFNFMAGVSLKF
jgi:iron complex outermembrane receptor protein